MNGWVGLGILRVSILLTCHSSLKFEESLRVSRIFLFECERDAHPLGIDRPSPLPTPCLVLIHLITPQISWLIRHFGSDGGIFDNFSWVANITTSRNQIFDGINGRFRLGRFGAIAICVGQFRCWLTHEYFLTQCLQPMQELPESPLS